MDKYYKPIASVQLQHDFYATKSLPAATLIPFPETTLFFKNHRMLFKRKSDLYVILQEANSDTKEVTIKAEPAVRALFFGVNFNDRHYQLRAGLNYDPRREKIVMETGENETLLVSENNVMPCWNTLAVQGEEPVAITDKSGAVVFSSAADSKAAFNNLDTGVYKANEAPFLKCNQCSEFDAILVFELSEADEPLVKKIVLPAGRYYWRYKIQKKYSQPETLALMDENETVSFDSNASSIDDLFVFLSKEPVALSELISTSLVLYNNDIIVKKFLPVPELENARFLSAEEKTLVLEAYVTV